MKSELILDAAVHVFSTKGFADATVEDVAREAGVGKGTVYLYFESKEQLLKEVVAKAMVEFREGLHQIETERLPLKQTLERYLGFTLRFAQENRELAHFIMDTGSIVGGAFPGRFRALKWHIVNILKATVDRAVETGELQASVEHERHLMALIGGVIVACLAHILQQERDPNADQHALDPSLLADILWSGIQGVQSRGKREVL